MTPEKYRYASLFLLLAGSVSLFLLICTTGCAGVAPAQLTWSVDGSGILSLKVPPPRVTESVLFSNATLTKSRIVFLTEDAEVITYLAAPSQPRAAIVFVPGAGEQAAGHDSRMTEYAQNGYAFLFLDVRGNGGETPGRPLNLEDDFGRFTSGLTPQYYSTVGDIILAADYLGNQYHGPVYVVGSSNGGRYAAIAAAIDPAIAGYIGISTSGFGGAGNAYTGDARKFLLSVDPDTSISRIAPRPVLVFHAPEDPIIPSGQGKALFDLAGEPKQFIAFNGSHGINDEVDRGIFTFLGSRT